VLSRTAVEGGEGDGTVILTNESSYSLTMNVNAIGQHSQCSNADSSYAAESEFELMS